jgi:hypothetical protein
MQARQFANLKRRAEGSADGPADGPIRLANVGAVNRLSVGPGNAGR